MRTLLLTALLFFSLRLSSQATEPEYRQVLQRRTWSFPRDHGRHDGYKTEWWYFTGNLREKSTGRQFGYQLTFFRSAVTPQSPSTRPSPWALHDLYFAHAAVSDIADQRFVFKDRLERGRPGLAEASDKTMDVHLLDWSATLDANGMIRLAAKENAFAIDLTCHGGRGPILEGPGGVNRKGTQPGQASYYYSLTRLVTDGSLVIDGKDFAVEGLSWMDHEFSSNTLSSNQVGWDWMGLTLNNGNDLMIYRLRDRSGRADYLSGTLVHPDGTPQYLAAADLQLSGSQPWTSPQSHAAYPQVWNLRVRGLAPLVVHSLMPGQELITGDSTKISYFEGAADVLNDSGKAIGQGYLEMTGYAEALGGSGALAAEDKSKN